MKSTVRGLALVVAIVLCITSLDLSAQAPQKVYRIGWLGTSTPGLNEGLHNALRQGLRSYGWIDGQNIAIEFRWAHGREERLPELAAEFVKMKVDIIVAPVEPAILAAMGATTTIPIVMATAADPVGTGLVDSLARPGRNVTGLTLFAPDLAAKRLQLLKDVVPGLSRVAVLWNSENTGKRREADETRRAAAQLGLQFEPFLIRGPNPDLDRIFPTIAARAQALIVLGESLTFAQRARIQTLAARNRVPAIYETRAFLDAGGLMSYGPDVTDMYRRAAYYVDRLLKGAMASDLPIEQPSKIELVINRKTAVSLGLMLPATLLMRADQVID